LTRISEEVSIKSGWSEGVELSGFTIESTIKWEELSE